MILHYYNITKASKLRDKRAVQALHFSCNPPKSKTIMCLKFYILATNSSNLKTAPTAIRKIRHTAKKIILIKAKAKILLQHHIGLEISCSI